MSGEGAAVTFLLQQITKLLTEYKDLKDGARYEFKQLQDELDQLKAFLKDSDEKSKKDNVFKEREKKIRELIYDVEDVIETCLTKMVAAKNKSVFSRWIAKFSTDMAQRVKLLRQQSVRPILDVMDKELVRNGDRSSTSFTQVKKDQSMRQTSVTVFQDVTAGQQDVTTRHHQSFNQQDGIVDFKDEGTIVTTTDHQSVSQQDGIVDFEDEGAIISYLMEPRDELDVISISGMAGMGKTTLAWKIFENEEIRHKFPLRMWIRVSQEFRSRDTFLDILKKLRPQLGTNKPSDEELIATIRECLSGEEFILVMDDVWTVQDWDAIEKILPKKNGKGKVLITSRVTVVAQQTNILRRTLLLDPLPSGKSLELLKLKVFGNTEACPKELDGIGQAIADKCGGVPLIIVVVGGVLKLKSSINKSIHILNEVWSEVLNDVNKIIQKDEKKSISNVLQLSYDILPHDLRKCFLYMGLFPENHEISASTLTQLWVAEGFIVREDGQNLEEIAESFLDALINMNLLLVGKKNLDQVKTCEVHSMVREFCRTKAMEQNLFRVMQKSTDGIIEPPVSEVEKFRRICLHFGPSEFFSENPMGPHVRSFLCFFDEPFDLDPRHASTIPGAFKSLRVLNCKSIRLQKFPEVKRLVLLKHISLFIDNLDVVPQQISKLVNLQTLIVLTNLSVGRSIAMKANIWKMIELRRLKSKRTMFLCEMKWKGKACENLQTISRLSPESCKPDLWKRAPNLKALGIQGKVANLFTTFSLEKFQHLEKLKVVNDLYGEKASDNLLLHLPQADHFPSKLTRLTLSETYLKWDHHMPILAQIKTLKVLKLKNKAFTGIFWISTTTSEGIDTTTSERIVPFPKLQLLLIEDCDLVTWEASSTHFPCLTWLVINECKDLKEIPESLGKVLEKLEIRGLQKSAAESARKIESHKQHAEKKGKSQWGAPFKLTVVE